MLSGTMPEYMAEVAGRSLASTSGARGEESELEADARTLA